MTGCEAHFSESSMASVQREAHRSHRWSAYHQRPSRGRSGGRWSDAQSLRPSHERRLNAQSTPSRLHEQRKTWLESVLRQAGMPRMGARVVYCVLCVSCVCLPCVSCARACIQSCASAWGPSSACVCACMHACMRACVSVCVKPSHQETAAYRRGRPRAYASTARPC